MSTNKDDLENLRMGSHSHDYTGDHRQLDGCGVVPGWSATLLSIVTVVFACGLLGSPLGRVIQKTIIKMVQTASLHRHACVRVGVW